SEPLGDDLLAVQAVEDGDEGRARPDEGSDVVQGAGEVVVLDRDEERLRTPADEVGRVHRTHGACSDDGTNSSGVVLTAVNVDRRGAQPCGGTSGPSSGSSSPRSTAASWLAWARSNSSIRSSSSRACCRYFGP